MKNLRKHASALKYDGKNAPSIVAQGDDELARQIVEIAEKYGVFVHKDPMLTQVLAQLHLGDEIPESLYLVVAKVISFVYLLEEKYPNGYEGHSDIG